MLVCPNKTQKGIGDEIMEKQFFTIMYENKGDELRCYYCKRSWVKEYLCHIGVEANESQLELSNDEAGKLIQMAYKANAIALSYSPYDEEFIKSYNKNEMWRLQALAAALREAFGELDSRSRHSNDFGEEEDFKCSLFEAGKINSDTVEKIEDAEIVHADKAK